MSNTNPLRCAVIGVGYLGRFHAQKYKVIEGIQFVGVSDSNSENGKKVAEELGVGFFANPKDLLGKVDAVTIAATTSAHFELGKLFLEAGIHVHVEKPLTTTAKEGIELVRIAKEKSLVLQVGHVERFNPALMAAREKLGRPLFIECHRLAPFKPRGTDVDVILDLMIHDLDVVLSLVKSEPVSVSAVGIPVLTKTNDIANARVEFASGTVANITASRVSQKSERKFRVFQQSQYLSIDFGMGVVNLMSKKPTEEIELSLNALDFDSWSLEKGDALLAETQSFLECVRDGKRPLVSGEDGLKALQLAEWILSEITKRQSQFGLV